MRPIATLFIESASDRSSVTACGSGRTSSSSSASAADRPPPRLTAPCSVSSSSEDDSSEPTPPPRPPPISTPPPISNPRSLPTYLLAPPPVVLAVDLCEALPRRRVEGVVRHEAVLIRVYARVFACILERSAEFFGREPDPSIRRSHDPTIPNPLFVRNRGIEGSAQKSHRWFRISQQAGWNSGILFYQSSF